MDAFDLKMLGAGGNWVNLCGLISLGLCGYYSPMPKGSTVSVTTADPGPSCTFAPQLVASGKYHIAITTPSFHGRAAYEGLPPFKERLPIRAIGEFPHDDRLVMAVRRETGIESLADIARKKYPLKVSTPTPEMQHPAGIISDMICREYGFSFADIEAWGGKILSDRPKNQNALNTPAIDPSFDAIFDEAIMTRRWPRLAESYDLKFLPIGEDVIKKMAAYGMLRGTLPRERFPYLIEEIPTIDFSGWLMFCHQDLPDDIVYWTMGAIAEQKEAIEARFPPPYAGMTGKIDFARMAARSPIPLHPGAARFYKERGYI